MKGLRTTEVLRVYERFAATNLGSDGIRPGGLELTGKALDLAGLDPGSTIIDIGCGSGVSLNFIKEHYVDLRCFGLDLSAEMLKIAGRSDVKLDLVRGSVAELPFEDNSADAILMECSLSLMNYSEESCFELNRVLKSDGLLMLTDVYARNTVAHNPFNAAAFDCCLKGAITQEDIVKRLEASGFELGLWEDHSQALKDFTVRVILGSDSVEEFWGPFFGRFECCDLAGNDAPPFRPGYFLAQARKTFSLIDR